VHGTCKWNAECHTKQHTLLALVSVLQRVNAVLDEKRISPARTWEGSCLGGGAWLPVFIFAPAARESIHGPLSGLHGLVWAILVHGVVSKAQSTWQTGHHGHQPGFGEGLGEGTLFALIVTRCGMELDNVSTLRLTNAGGLWPLCLAAAQLCWCCVEYAWCMRGVHYQGPSTDDVMLAVKSPKSPGFSPPRRHDGWRQVTVRCIVKQPALFLALEMCM
jgi:hypothetical protein